MVKLNSERNPAPKKPRKPMTSAPNSGVKLNKPKITFETSFLKGRYRWALGFVFLSLFALIARAAYVQIVNVEELTNEADKRSLRVQEIKSARGSILDRNGQMLSISVPMFQLKVDPKVILENDGIAKNKEKWKALAEVLGMSYKDLVSKIESKPKLREIVLARQISEQIKNYAQDLKLPTMIISSDYRRFYPRAEETAHLLGFTDVDNNGIEGIEKSFNSLLVGKSGSRTYRKDKYGNIVEDIANIKKYDAHNVTLSIDKDLQAMVYLEIKKAVAENNASSGTAVLVDVRTGEILAMVNAPSYNPNKRTGVSEDLMRNKAVTDTFEPGSTVKPFVVLTALQNKVVRRDEVINTGPLVLTGKEIRDVAPRDRQTLDEILINSSNRGMSRLALRMPPSALMDTYQAAGLGKPTDLGLGGEQIGYLNANRKRWSDIERANVSYGYGINATPVQIARAYLTLGSFGIYRPLSITKVDPPVIGNRVFSEKITRDVVNIMEKVAIKNKRALVEGYRVAIKTGTAKKIEKGRYVDKYMAYTAGIAPVTDPRFALVILIDEPKAGQYYGGAVSAPVFSAIMGAALRAYNITPDGVPVENTKTTKRIVRRNEQPNPNQLN
ncbi:peptidoglycan glycosyltransferase [Actinobacillus porcinus]|uniref:Peptidoglycan D,D-transpeptidase FtsI n=1 Tax=Actinobacillus porcinus TaxID=51048 RepID=A0ABY6TLC6_9PAST|nr:peptidoglycan glycosyltransferase [Actinobacillus porcinus]VTU09042.1 peptidoglycan glycosyltransferase [Actinobacillus porcinus]